MITVVVNKGLLGLGNMQVDLNKLWRIVNRTYSLWKKEELVSRRLRAQIERLEQQLKNWTPASLRSAAH